MKKLYIGLMSGTSLDGVDVAIVDFNDDKPSLVASSFNTYPAELLSNLRNACQQESTSFNKLGTLDSQLGCFYAKCIQQALSAANLSSNDILAIGSHGQTIQHSPNSNPPFTLQIGDANCIAEETGITVVADFRRRDIAAGGQGAPLVPAFHQFVFQSNNENIAIINIGGISNVTFLSKNNNAPVIGFDCGPGNTLMDQWCLLHFGIPYDHSGKLSKEGNINATLLANMLDDPYFTMSYPKSTGPEHFNIEWLNTQLDKYPTNIKDTLSTLCELTAQCIKQSLEQLPTTNKALICGGGVHNKHLMNRLNTLLEQSVETTACYGADPDWVEAIAFAWLAKQTMEGKTGNLPSVTGAKKAVVLGAIYSA